MDLNNHEAKHVHLRVQNMWFVWNTIVECFDEFHNKGIMNKFPLNLL